MNIAKKHFPAILSENELAYFGHLEGIISSIDELSSLQIVKTKKSYNFRLASSVPKYNDLLIKEILKFHNVFGINLDMSKSIKTTSTIVFKIQL